MISPTFFPMIVSVRGFPNLGTLGLDVIHCSIAAGGIAMRKLGVLFTPSMFICLIITLPTLKLISSLLGSFLFRKVGLMLTKLATVEGTPVKPDLSIWLTQTVKSSLV